MRRHYQYLLAIILVAVLLRVVRLDHYSLWYDEAFAVLFSEKGLDAMLYGTLAPVQGGASDIHPLLYYMTLNTWMNIFGQSTFVVRLWSVILGVLTICVVYRLSDILFNPRTALATATITALAPYHIHYSQEARMYSLLALLLTSATLCFVEAEKSTTRSRWAWWICFGILAGLSMYTQQLAAFFLVSIGIFPLFRRERSSIAGMAVGTIVALIVYFPWLVNIPSQLEKVASYYWIASPGIDKIFVTLYVFMTNYAEIKPPYSLLALIGSLVLLLLGFIQLALVLRYPGRIKRQERTAIGLICWLFAFPIALMWLVSQIQPVYLERGLIGSAIMLYIFLGWIFTRGGFPRVIAIFLVFIGLGQVIIGLWSQYTLNSFPYSPFNEITSYIGTNWEDEDVVVHMNKLSALPGLFYNRELTQRYLADLPGSSEDTLAIPTQETLQFLADECIQEVATNANRIWFITFDRAEQEYSAINRPELNEVRTWLDNHFELLSLTEFNDLNLYLYGNGKLFSSRCDM